MLAAPSPVMCPVQDRVRNAFNPCSYTSIGSLPTYMGHDFASRSRASAIEGAGIGGPHNMKCGKAPQFFMEYEYTSEPYGLVGMLGYGQGIA